MEIFKFLGDIKNAEVTTNVVKENVYPELNGTISLSKGIFKAEYTWWGRVTPMYKMEDYITIEDMEFDKRNDRNDEVFSKAIKAGKRTYFFDIKTTKGNELYLTLTESKKVTEDGREFFQKHKIFLYKEDFQKFRDGLDEIMNKLEELNETGSYKNEPYPRNENRDSDFTFESL